MKKAKTAVIGLGNIGLKYDFDEKRIHPATHVFGYLNNPDCELVCGIDFDDRIKCDFFKYASNAKFFSSIEEAIREKAIFDVDIVSICTPQDTHLRLIKELINNHIGRILFCEKPIASNVKEARELKRLLKNDDEVIVVPNISRRWNTELNHIRVIIDEKRYGQVKKIAIRYTRGIYNTGSHLFDLIQMWLMDPIQEVQTIGVTDTSANPEKSYSFAFKTQGGVCGYAEAIDDRDYYLFDVDLYMSNGKIEMRYSGDEVIYYSIDNHHLFNGFKELIREEKKDDLLRDNCMENAIKNIVDVANGTDSPRCTLNDAIYPILVAETIEKSYMSGKIESVVYE